MTAEQAGAAFGSAILPLILIALGVWFGAKKMREAKEEDKKDKKKQ
jgi:hypothetical protein